MGKSDADAPQQLAPPQLLADTLGFTPQLLLDDIINIANHAVQDGVNGVEDFLQQRLARQLGDVDGTNEVEQGLVAFQTLLEFHTDVAFDVFEAWSLRNVFAVPADLPIVLPHHENLDLTQTPDHEQALMDEIDDLRARIESQRRLRQQLKRANHRQDTKVRKARKVFEILATYEPTVVAARSLPAGLMAMHESVSSLPELEPATISALAQLRLTEAGKRQWEMGRTGYINWAIAQLLVKSEEDGGNELLPDVANAEMFRKASAAMDIVSRDLASADGGDGDEAMEE
ncbi:Mis12 protein-domain-containing protein [Mycena epipterygia]|nr:Mis12 protein-domain-containing protein [Mycena epipterygia]